MSSLCLIERERLKAHVPLCEKKEKKEEEEKKIRRRGERLLIRLTCNGKATQNLIVIFEVVHTDCST